MVLIKKNAFKGSKSMIILSSNKIIARDSIICII